MLTMSQGAPCHPGMRCITRDAYNATRVRTISLTDGPSVFFLFFLQLIVLGMQDKPRDSTVNAAVLARQTPGFSGAELSNLVNEAALLAAKTSKPSLSAELLDSARDKALMGVERRWASFSHPSGTQLVNQSNQSINRSMDRSIDLHVHSLGLVRGVNRQ